MKKFLNTAWGSYLKVFLSAILTIYLSDITQGVDPFIMNIVMIKKLLTAGIISVLPIIINALNPEDTRYGKK